MSALLLALPGATGLLRPAHVFPRFFRVGFARPVVSVSGYAFLVGVADLGARFLRHLAPSAVVTRVARLSRLLQVLDSVIRRVFVYVVDHIASANRVLGMHPVPHVDVPEDVPVFVDRRVQVPFLPGNTEEDAAIMGPRSCSASPVVVVLPAVGGRQLGARFRAGLPNPVVVGALPGAELRDELGGVVARELNAALRARSCGLHKADYTQVRKEA